MAYTFPYTAEQIEDRLNLIDKNKNLLPYPYDYSPSLPASLEDVGDGSILTNSTGTSVAKVFLKAFALLEGTYKVSTEVADIIDETEVAENPGFDLEIEGVTVTDGQFTLSTETTIEVYLKIPASFDTGLLVKPMIRKADTTADWVPNMDKIGTYVDRRFNGTNAKIKVLADYLADFADIIEIEEVED